MKRDNVLEVMRSSVIELFRRQKEDEEQARLSLGDLVREGARLMLQTALEVELEEFLGREYYQRGNRKRQGHRNGTYSRPIKTLAGDITVKKPKVRDNEEPFHSEILKAWQRRCDELSALIPGLYLEGLSTRDFQRALKAFWGESGLSRSTISRLNLRLYEEFETWRKRDLSKEQILFLFLDGLYAGVRFETSDKEAVLVAHGYRKDGSRVVLGIIFGGRESTSSWSELLHDLEGRGLCQPILVISDGNPGLIAALKAAWPDLPRQRCVKHRTKNILDKVLKSEREEVRKALNKIWYSSDEKTALENARAFVNQYGRKYETATQCLLECLPDCLTFFRFPEEYWVHIRTSNLLERTFREVRRRTKVVGRFPTESSALVMIYGVLTIDSPKWRGLNLGEEAIKEIEIASKNVRENPIQLDFIREVA
jgi:transposase-like protein